MGRRRLSLKQRAAIFDRHGGICHICAGLIEGPFELEHVVPLALRGEDGGENLRPAHPSCHAEKTPGDIRIIAKAKRIEKKHTGTYRAPRHIVPGSKASRWRKPLNGPAVLRTRREEA